MRMHRQRRDSTAADFILVSESMDVDAGRVRRTGAPASGHPQEFSFDGVI